MEPIAKLILRLAYGGLFLYTSTTLIGSGWSWTVETTGLLFPSNPKLFALFGVISMIAGGLAIVLGLLGRVGAATLVAFLVLGAWVHDAQRELALRMAAEVETFCPAAKATVNSLGWSAFGGHLSSALKNYALAGVGIAFMIGGTGRWSMLTEEQLRGMLRTRRKAPR